MQVLCRWVTFFHPHRHLRTNQPLWRWTNRKMRTSWTSSSLLGMAVTLAGTFRPNTKLHCCREWMEGNQRWKQAVSSAVSTRTEVIQLEELLDTKIQQRQARETGICPIRRELYSQCFGKEPHGDGGWQMYILSHTAVASFHWHDNKNPCACFIPLLY